MERNYLNEAIEIIRGESMLQPERRHLEALATVADHAQGKHQRPDGRFISESHYAERIAQMNWRPPADCPLCKGGIA